MNKKTVLIVFACVMVVGLLTAVVGFAMGGGGGSLNVKDGHWMYSGREGNVQLGSAPYWAQRLSGRNWYLFGGGRYDAIDDAIEEALEGPLNDDWDDDLDDWDDDHYDYNYDYDYDYDYDYHFTPGSSKVDNVAPPVAASQLGKIDIDIDAGFVVVKTASETGNEVGLKVEGPLAYKTYMDEGVWHIDSKHNGLDWRSGGFWLNGQNMSTKFTLTVPDHLDELDVDINAGDANLRGLSVGELDVGGGAASISLTDITTNNIDLSIQAGAINTSNVTAAEADFSCQAGAINFKGNLTGEVDVECQAGSITILMPRPADYGWKANATMGDVSIDGQGASGLTSDTTGGNQNALPYFDLESSVGSVKVTFN